MTRGEAVTALRDYIRYIPKRNFHRVYLRKCSTYQYLMNKVFVAEELIRQIQNTDQDPLKTVRKFCELMSDTQMEADISHVLTLRFAKMSERNGLEIYQFLREKERGTIYGSGNSGKSLPFYAEAVTGNSYRFKHWKLRVRDD